MNQGFADLAVPVIPRELTGSTPRQVRLMGNGVKAVILGAFLLAIATAVGILLCTNAVKQIHRRTALRRDGRVVVGEVTREGGRRVSFVEYTFTVRGSAFSGWAQLPDDLLGRIRKSDHIFVRFLPADPAINHPDAWEWSVLFDSVPIVEFAFFLAAGGSFFAILFTERRFVREGRPTVATVTSCKRRERLFFLEYDFSKEDGTSIKGSGESRSPRKIGSNIYVLYLPQSPHRSRPYPTLSFRVRVDAQT